MLESYNVYYDENVSATKMPQNGNFFFLHKPPPADGFPKKGCGVIVIATTL